MSSALQRAIGRGVTAPSGAVSPRGLADTARAAVARLRPGTKDGRRVLPIRRSAEEIRQLWSEPATRTAVLDGIPAADASLDVGTPDHEWGTTTSLRLQVKTAVPGQATQALAGKALRRFKALAETGEIPTTDHNPSARPDAGEPT